MSLEEKLTKAVKKNDREKFTSLLVELKEPGRRSWALGAAPLHQAALLGRYMMVLKLVNSGIDINSYGRIEGRHWQNGTPLHFAVLGKQETILKQLLELGADTTLVGGIHDQKVLIMETPLELARRKKRSHLVDILQKHMAEGGHPKQDKEQPTLKGAAAASAPSADEDSSHEAKAQATAKPSAPPADPNADDQYPDPEANQVEEDPKGKIEKEMLHINNTIAHLLDRRGQKEVDEEIIKLVENRGKLADEMAALEVTAREDEGDKPTCPICFNVPRQVYSCSSCENWICGNCNAKLVICPSCREDLLAKPTKRNKTAERILEL